MAIFGKLRTFGQRIFGKPSVAAKLRREADVENVRAQSAARDAADAARQQQELSPRGRAAASARAGERSNEEQRRKLAELAKREREAREEAAKARTRMEELRRKADNAELEAARTENLRNRGREEFLKARRDMTPEEFGRIFPGQLRPVAPKLNKNRKEVGGLLPELAAFLYLRVPLTRFASSNVQSIVYDNLSKSLHVQYIKSQLWYRYAGVPHGIARQAYYAVSKGVFSWDALRIRGTRNGNKFTTFKDVPPELPIDPTSTAGQIALSNVGL